MSFNKKSSSSKHHHHHHNHHHNDDEDDDQWLFDSIVHYLKSPIWSTPIQQFIENYCAIFSPESGWSGGALLDDRPDRDRDRDRGDDESSSDRMPPKQFREIHKKYKELVDLLINTFIQDIGVSYSEFVRACRNNSRFVKHPIYIELFEQIWSADNFDMFKSQMIKKNIELELQALILLQHQLGIISTSTESPDSHHHQTNDDLIMDIVIKQSKDEYDNLMNNRQRFSQMAAAANSSSLSSSSSRQQQQQQQQKDDLEVAKKLVRNDELVETLRNELDHQEYKNRRMVQELTSDSMTTLKSTSKYNNNNYDDDDDNDHNIDDADRDDADRRRRHQSHKSSSSKDASSAAKQLELLKLNPLKVPRKDFKDDFEYGGGGRGRGRRYDDSDEEDAAGADLSNKKEMLDSSKIVNSIAQSYLAGGNVSEAELRRRAEFMQRQRDLLAEKKRQERQKQLDQFMRDSEAHGDPKRPMSSRAARSLLSGADPSDIQQSKPANLLTDEERRKIEARKALAETLKKEVVNSSNNNNKY